jgi:hypothetical protein
MITLHTFDNEYDDGQQYIQFYQREGQPLLESQGVCQYETLRDFLKYSIIEECVIDLFTNADLRRISKLLLAVMETGDIEKLLRYAVRIYLHDSRHKDLARTRFGQWTYNARRLDTSPVQSADPLPRIGVDLHGYLLLPNGETLTRTTELGDVGSLLWPQSNITRLRNALYDAREVGDLPDVPAVILPNGEAFEIEGLFWKVGDVIRLRDQVAYHTLTHVESLPDGTLFMRANDGWTVNGVPESSVVLVQRNAVVFI